MKPRRPKSHAVFRTFVARHLRVFAYANNHYAGHGPATLKLFRELWEKK